MKKKRSKYYIVTSSKNQHLAGAFPLTPEGKRRADVWAQELTKTRQEKFEITEK